MPAPGSHKTASRFDLTKRQRDVIHLMARGKTNFEIAQELGISLEGAKYHVREILLRLDVDSREDAVAAWRANQRPLARAARTLSALWAGGWVAWAVVGGLAVLACGGAAAAIVLSIHGGSPATATAAPSSASTTVSASTDDGSPTPTAVATAAKPVSTVAPPKDPPALWHWSSDNAGDVPSFGVSPSVVAVSVAPYKPGPGYVAALDASTGEERWRVETPSAPWPPVVTKRSVVFGTDSGTVRALDLVTGATLWSIAFPGFPFQVVDAGGTIVVADADPSAWLGSNGVGAFGLLDKSRLAGRVWGLDPTTGHVLWKADMGAPQALIAASGGTVVISEAGPGATKTIAVDSISGEQLWAHATDSVSTPPVISGTVVYVTTSSGTLSALDLHSGRELWKVSQTAGSGAFYFPFADSTELFVSTSSTVEARNPTNGELLWAAGIYDCSGPPGNGAGARTFSAAGQVFLYMCGGIFRVETNDRIVSPWLIGQGQFPWLEPIEGGILVSSDTGEGASGMLALGVS